MHELCAQRWCFLALAVLVGAAAVATPVWWAFQRLGYVVDGQPTAYSPVGYPAFVGLCFRLFGTEWLALRKRSSSVRGGSYFLGVAIEQRPGCARPTRYPPAITLDEVSINEGARVGGRNLPRSDESRHAPIGMSY